MLVFPNHQHHHPSHHHHSPDNKYWVVHLISRQPSQIIIGHNHSSQNCPGLSLFTNDTIIIFVNIVTSHEIFDDDDALVILASQLSRFDLLERISGQSYSTQVLIWATLQNILDLADISVRRKTFNATKYSTKLDAKAPSPYPQFANLISQTWKQIPAFLRCRCCSSLISGYYRVTHPRAHRFIFGIKKKLC